MHFHPEETRAGKSVHVFGFGEGGHFKNS